MRNCFLLFCLWLPLSAFTQTAYFDAIRLSENATDYKEFIRAIDDYKIENAAKGVIVKFGQDQEEQILRDLLRFLKDPFYARTNPSTYMHQVDAWLNEAPIWTYIQPTFQVTPNGAILNEYQDTIYLLNKDHTVTSIITQQASMPMYFQDEKNERLPSEEEELIAVYNPNTRLFFEWRNGQFNPTPVAYYNGQQIYEGVPTIIPNTNRYYAFDLEDNQTYRNNGNDTYFNLIYRNKKTDSITISFLALIDENEHLNGSPQADFPLTASAGAPADLLSTSDVSYSSVSFPSKAINAVAQFLVDRSKQELLLAFFDRFLEKMHQTKELQVLFPNTFYLLKTQDAFRLPSIGQLWVESFQGDVQEMLHNLEFLLTTDPAYAAIADQHQVRAFRLTNDLLRNYEEDISSINILHQLNYKYQEIEDPISDNLDLLTTLAKELIADEEAQSFLTANQLMRLSYPTNEYFVALLYLNNQYALQKLFVDPDISPLQQFQYSMVKVIQTMVNLSSLLQNVEHKSSHYREKLLTDNDEGATDELFFHFSQSLYKLLEFGFSTQYLFQPVQYYNSLAYQDCIPMIRNTIQATEDLKKEELGIFIIHLSQLLEPIISAKVASKKEVPDNGTPKILKDIFFYSSFMVDILSANSTAQVNGILQQYALPVGSYRLKRQSKFSLSLNAYPGLHVGKEEGLENNLNKGNVIGITAPLGIAASWGKSRKKDGHAISLFMPIIDVGAAFSYRWSGEAEGFPAQLQWRQVLSPGAHIVWGIKKVPLSIMLGTQFTPQLRAIKGNGSIGLDQNVWRYGISLVMDIPIFNLYVEE